MKFPEFLEMLGRATEQSMGRFLRDSTDLVSDNYPFSHYLGITLDTIFKKTLSERCNFIPE